MSENLGLMDFPNIQYSDDGAVIVDGKRYMRVKPCHMCEGTGESEEYISGICGYCNSTGWVIA